MKLNSGNLIGVMIVSAGALVLMVTIGAGAGLWSSVFGDTGEERIESIPIPKAAVQVRDVTVEPIEIVDAYYGIIRPLERYKLAFEVAGRIEEFGTNDQGRPLDVEDEIASGEVIARLNSRLLSAQLKEAKSRLEQAQAEMKRSDERKVRNAITGEEYQERVTTLEVADAQVQMAEKRLWDATLIAPVDGVVSQRLANVGESVGAHQAVFEILDVHHVLLVIEVPESRIQNVRRGQTVYVELRARDVFGRVRRDLDAKVYQVAEAADDRTGMFEVEIVLDNSERRLKPGLVAVGRIVIDRIEGFRLPDYAAVLRDGKSMLFAVNPLGKAIAYELTEFIEQNGELILHDLPETHRKVVVGGQHRLVAGREVEIFNLEEGSAAQPQSEVSVRSASADAGG